MDNKVLFGELLFLGIFLSLIASTLHSRGKFLLSGKDFSNIAEFNGYVREDGPKLIKSSKILFAITFLILIVLTILFVSITKSDSTKILQK